MLLQQVQQLLHMLMIDFGFAAEEPIQRHVRSAEFAQNVLLLFGRAHAPKLSSKISDCDLLPAVLSMLALIVID